MESPTFDRKDESSLFNTVDEVAKKLKTNRKTVYDAIARREIPVVRIGRLIRIPNTWLRRAAAE